MKTGEYFLLSASLLILQFITVILIRAVKDSQVVIPCLLCEVAWFAVGTVVECHSVVKMGSIVF